MSESSEGDITQEDWDDLAASKQTQKEKEKVRVRVNGVGITQADINRETQYHPANNLREAKNEATRALVVRELLLQKAEEEGICTERPKIEDEETIIETLLEREVETPEYDRDACYRYFEKNRDKFRTSPLYDISHILIPAPPDDYEARDEAEETAKSILKQVHEKPDQFADIAKAHSSCPSAEDGGHMGQIGKGQTSDSFERALFEMAAGEISQRPVETRYGYHIIKVHNCAPGHPLEFEDVRTWIAEYLEANAWQRAVAQYIQLLAGSAEIKGFDMKEAGSPLVQ